MTRIHSFPPVSRPDATRLILGSMPGRASLAANEYYAHPRNAFWQLLELNLAIPATLPYRQRCEQLVHQHIALWDVLKTCTRKSSLDSDIDTSSIVPNAFTDFFASHPRITLVCFNGAAAENIYRRHVLPALPPALRELELRRLPSTSPANASIPLAEKIRQWRVLGQSAVPPGKAL
jgi:TDG/mug DNA glycosylase family protein